MFTIARRRLTRLMDRYYASHQRKEAAMAADSDASIALLEQLAVYERVATVKQALADDLLPKTRRPTAGQPAGMAAGNQARPAPSQPGRTTRCRTSPSNSRTSGRTFPFRFVPRVPLSLMGMLLELLRGE
jgi:hypothetical protein